MFLLPVLKTTLLNIGKFKVCKVKSKMKIKSQILIWLSCWNIIYLKLSPGYDIYFQVVLSPLTLSQTKTLLSLSFSLTRCLSHYQSDWQTRYWKFDVSTLLHWTSCHLPSGTYLGRKGKSAEASEFHLTSRWKDLAAVLSHKKQSKTFTHTLRP